MAVGKAGAVAKKKTPSRDERAFAEVVRLIESSRGRAKRAEDTELIDLYWRVGEMISRKIEAAEWGDGVVEGRDFFY